MPDLFAGTRGRLATFFLLYVSEGIPFGFAATAVVTQMRRQGAGPAQLGLFTALLYLPWSWKWAAGPFVDLVYSRRFGRRRLWIILCQCGMIATLLAAMAAGFSRHLTLFTWIILVHNMFASVQDVAIDALAVSVLREQERGLANGLMFAGQYLGTAVGGAGVLFLTGYGVPFGQTFAFVAAAVALITCTVVLPLREPPAPPLAEQLESAAARHSGAARALSELRAYIATAARSMIGIRSAFVALLFALLPTGAYGLSMAIGSSLAVEFGMSDHEIASLNLGSTVLAAAGCVAGGWLSDKLGRRRMLATYIVMTVVPSFVMAWATQRHGWVMPLETRGATRPVAPTALVALFWAMTLAYTGCQGLMYGARTALFMDVSNPAVAATQFTAYMAMLNLVISYSAAWQGWSASHLGYPITFLLDASAGLVCLAVLPFVRRRPGAVVDTTPGFPVVASAQ
jgi:MFS family permease